MQRVLNTKYSERDIKDVESYVRDIVRGMSTVAPAEQEELVVRGIFLVRRIARALPPEASLAEALRDHLAEGLTAMLEEEGPPPPVGEPSPPRARRAA
jgi:hypothetical protein